MRIRGTPIRRGFYAPLLGVLVRIQGAELLGLGLVDSGADGIVVDGEVVYELGVLPDQLTPAPGSKTVGGEIDTRACIGEVIYDGVALCDQFQVQGYAWELPWNLVLGRVGLFDKYSVRFDWHERPPSFTLMPRG